MWGYGGILACLLNICRYNAAAIPADVVLVEDVIVLLVKTVPKMASTLTLQLLLGAAGMV